jgi:CDP-glycerol glycerophosphotransferase (TagB/SpsB family)
MDLIADKKNSLEVSKEIYNFEDKLIELIEESVWGDDIGLSGLLEKVEKSRKQGSYYLNAIFEEGKVSSLVLSLFFRFFPEELNTFYFKLKERKDNLDFLSQVIKALESLNTELSFLVLSHIYSFSGEIIRVEVIKAMRKIAKANKGFLVTFLKGSSRIMKREILLTLFDNKKELSLGLKELFCLPNPFGRENKKLLENISIVEELRLKEAEEFLNKFTRLRFFWHAPLRKNALKALEAIR